MPARVMSPVFTPLTVVVPVTARVGLADPDKVTPLTVVGVIAPKVIVCAGVVVAVAVVPETPFAVTMEAEVTVPAPGDTLVVPSPLSVTIALGNLTL